DEFGDGAAQRARKAALFKDLNLFHAETTRRVPAVWQQFQIMVEQSGLEIEPLRILKLAGIGALVGFVVAIAATGMWLAAFVGAAIGSSVPFVYVQHARKSRIHTLCMQLPEAFELMSRAVRAGQTMPGAMSLVATQLQEPISVEFAYCSEQQNLGLPQEVALQELARRTGVMELQLFVVAMLVHRTAGGNPVEILDSLSEVIRKRIRLFGKVKACTSEGRLQAVILSILPIVAFVALLVLNRNYVQILLDRPQLLAYVIGFELLGVLWIRRIVNFEF
ncbi:MAG: type II secretion system F family protein, partial [Planctomycetaceae bacterium]